MVIRQRPSSAIEPPIRLFGIGFVASIHLLCGTAHADDVEDDIKRAEQLFKEAREAVQQEDYATACPKFEESLKLARRAGTLFNLAQCEEHEGRLVSAMRYYKEGIVVLEPGDPRLAPSKKQLAIIEPRIPFLKINLATALPQGGRVTIDGREVEALGVEFQVDPGTHQIKVLAPKYTDETKIVHIAESVHESVTVKVGTRIADPTVAKVLGPRRIATIAAFGLGGIGFIGAVITGGMVISTSNRVQEGCPQTVCSTAEGYEASRTGKTLLVANTVAWGVTLAGATAGTVLLLTDRKKEPAKTAGAHSLMIGPGFVGVEGSF